MEIHIREKQEPIFLLKKKKKKHFYPLKQSKAALDTMSTRIALLQVIKKGLI